MTEELFTTPIIPTYTINQILGGEPISPDVFNSIINNGSVSGGTIIGGRYVGPNIEGATINTSEINLVNTYFQMNGENIINITGLRNIAVGIQAGNSLGSTDSDNSFLGYQAGYTCGNTTTASRNVFIGTYAGYTWDSSTGQNVFIGYKAGEKGQYGIQNVFIGSFSGDAVLTSTANANTFVGDQTGTDLTTGYSNVFIGTQVGENVTTGNTNTLLGSLAGSTFTTGTGNIFIGYTAGYYQTTSKSNTLLIDNQIRASAAVELTNSLVVGTMASTTANQIFRLNANVGILTSTFGANSDGVLAIANGTVPAAHVDNEIQLYSVDSSDNTSTLALMLEQVVEDIGTFTASHKIKIKVNGTEYWIQLDAV